VRRLSRLMEDTRGWTESPEVDRPKFLAAGADLDVFSYLLGTHPDWLSADETAYVRASRDAAAAEVAQKARAARRLRRFVWGLVAATVLLMSALGVAGWAVVQSQRSAAQALAQQGKAERSQRAAQDAEQKADASAKDASAAAKAAGDRLAQIEMNVAQSQTEEGDIDGALLLLLSSASSFDDTNAPDDLLINFDQALEAAADTETALLFKAPQAFDLANGLVLVDPASRDIYRLTDSLPPKRIVAGIPNDKNVIKVGEAADGTGLVLVRADNSVEYVALADGTRRTIGQFTQATLDSAEFGQPNFDITNNGLVIRSDWDGEEQTVHLQILDMADGKVAQLTFPDASSIRYAGDDGGNRYVFRQVKNDFLRLTGTRWTAPDKPLDRSASTALIVRMCSRGGLTASPALVQKVGEAILNTLAETYLTGLRCEIAGDRILLTRLSPSSSGEVREDTLISETQEAEDVRTLVSDFSQVGLALSNFTWVGAEPQTGTVGVLSNRESIVAGPDAIQRQRHTGTPVAARFLSPDAFAVVESETGRIVVQHVGIGGFRKRTTLVAPDPAGLAGTANPIDPYNKGSCVGRTLTPVATRFKIGGPVELVLTPGDRAVSQRVNIRITGEGDPVSVTPFVECVQFSRDWTRMLALSDRGVEVYDLTRIRRGERLEETRIGTLAGAEFTSAFFVGPDHDIISSSETRQVLRWHGGDDKWTSREIYRGEHPVIYAEPDADGSHLIILEKLNDDEIHRFYYSVRARRLWRDLGTDARLIGGAFDESLAIGSYDTLALHAWKPFLRFPPLSVLVDEAKAALPKSCAPTVAADYRNSPCWPAGFN
ncbi:MAG: hypothetical protein ABI399_12130, partial [Bauldia sp.]